MFPQVKPHILLPLRVYPGTQNWVVPRPLSSTEVPGKKVFFNWEVIGSGPPIRPLSNFGHTQEPSFLHFCLRLPSRFMSVFSALGPVTPGVRRRVPLDSPPGTGNFSRFPNRPVVMFLMEAFLNSIFFGRNPPLPRSSALYGVLTGEMCSRFLNFLSSLSRFWRNYGQDVFTKRFCFLTGVGRL